MGGENREISALDASSSLSWWLEAGVDVAIQEEPRNWLAPVPAKPAKTPEAEPQSAPPPRPSLPETLDLFREWLAKSPDLPLAAAGARRVLPAGQVSPAIMLIAEMPTREEELAGVPIAGAAAELMDRMLRSIGLSIEQAYSAPISCFHSPGARIDSAQFEACAEIARHQLRLVKPRLLLLLGKEPARALLGKPLASARGHVHKIEGVRTVATFHPRYLLSQPSQKALAWRDLLLLTEEDV
jgi:DNA polymerase